MTNVANEKHREWATQAVERFVSRFDESYRLLAYHAALPLVLTPELVNYLRNEFLRGEQVPWVAEVDLLLSDLCSQVGYELYSMDTHVRAYLLEQMEQDPRLGRQRMQEVAQVLISYVSYLSRLNPGRRQQEIEAQRWAAMVYLGDEQCKTAAQQIAKRLLETSSGTGSENLSQSGIRAELARLTRITEELSRPLQEEESLLRYARLVQQILRNPDRVNSDQLRDSYWVEGVELRFTDKFLPEPLAQTLAASRVTVTQFEGFPPIQFFSFEVATYLESEFEICTFEVATIEKVFKRDDFSNEENIKWLFQGSPKHYRMLDAIRDLEEVIWPVKIKSYFEQMAVEDLVLIWVSGKEAGIYALAKIVELLKESQEVPDIDYWINTKVLDSGNDKPKARLRFTTKLLEKPLLKEKLKQDDILKDLLIIRNPRFARTKITSEESKRIHELIKELDLIIKTETKEAEYYTEDLGDGVELDMISIPGGNFMMGSPEDEGNDSEKPQHQVTIQPFFMGKFQVTQAQWQTVMGNNPARFQDSPLNPVERVSWEEAVEFCDRLSQLTGKEYRLPTEAEWEYACRAGKNTPFHFGETISTELANYYGEETYGKGVKGEYREQTTPVGYFKVANNFGLYDMHGNVWEWCEDDWHENYQDAPTDGTAWLSGSSNKKVIRGGSWLDDPGYCRSAVRGSDTRGYRIDNIGFRVSCVAPRTT